MEFREIEFGTAEFDQELDLRRRVLRRPLGLDFNADQIAEEVSEIHLGAFEDEWLLAVLVLTPREDGELKMRQVAVEPTLQGSGIGGELVRFSEQVARERGFTTMVLSARETAVRFYERLGYSVVGEPYEEVTIPHRWMEKDL